MGQVYLARATGLGGFERQVVVKTLDLSITDDDESFVTMFLDEARLVGALHHQYIAPVYEVGCDEEGRYFLVMDYVNGETAEAVFRESNERGQTIPLAFSLTTVSCVASALDYAHSLCSADGTPLDIVHRDISLSNVMAGYDGGVKLIDFGIAKAANRATKTQVGTLKGKIGYLAPEQVLRRHVDHRADIFALGIVLYELTTQTRAFKESSDLIALERITKGDITPPSKVVAKYPPELEAIVMRALAVSPDDRFQDAGEMGRALEALASKLGIVLGHAPVNELMSRLFAEKRNRRRRLARASNEVSTDPSVQALDAAEHPDSDPDGDTDVRHPRASKPTLPLKTTSPSDEDRATVPIVARGTRDGMIPIDHPSRLPTPIPLEEQATNIVDPNVAVRFANQRIPLEDRPTPFADATLLDPPTQRDRKPLVLEQPRAIDDLHAPLARRDLGSSEVPVVARTVTGTPPPPADPQPGGRRRSSQQPLLPPPHRTPTGPQPLARPPSVPPPLPLPPMPRTITGPQLPDDHQDDPTEISGVMPLHRHHTGPTPTGLVAIREAAPKWGPAYVATAVVNRYKKTSWWPRDRASRTWLIMLGLFGVAIMVAILVALI